MNRPENNSTSLLHCPRCHRQPTNHTDPAIGYTYGCCRMALLTKFSMFQKVAADRWNKLVLKYREQMENTKQKFKQENEL